MSDRFGVEHALSLDLDELAVWATWADNRARLEARWIAEDVGVCVVNQLAKALEG